MELNDVLRRDRDKYSAFLMELIRADTSNEQHGVRGKEANGQAIVRDRLAKMGAVTDTFEPDYRELSHYKESTPGHDYTGRFNVVGAFAGAGGGKSLILNGHMDTMPFDESDGWTSPPLVPTVRDGRIYGRGACDMKAGLAGCIMAVDALREAGIRTAGDLFIESVVDEEGGGMGTLACCAKGYKADGAIVAEPTELIPRPAHMGWMFFRITFPGLATHSSRKWEGVNAIEKCVRFIDYALELERKWVQIKRHPYLPPPFFNIGTIKGGVASTVVPESCAIEMTVRFLPGECNENGWTGAETERQFRMAVESFCRGDDWLRENPPKVELYQFGGACDIGRDHPLVKCSIESIFERTGASPEPRGMESGCDARLLTNYAGTPAMAFGPGSLAQAHAVDEWVSIDQYLSYIDIVSHMIVRWCGQADH